MFGFLEEAIFEFIFEGRANIIMAKLKGTLT